VNPEPEERTTGQKDRERGGPSSGKVGKGPCHWSDTRGGGYYQGTVGYFVIAKMKGAKGVISGGSAHAQWKGTTVLKT